MRQIIILCLITLPAALALGQPSSATAVVQKNHGSRLQVRLGVDAGYQFTEYRDAIIAKIIGKYHGPAASMDLFILRKWNRWGREASGLRLSVGYGMGAGTNQHFPGGGPDGDLTEENPLNAWYLRANILYVFANDYYWVGAGLGGRFQQQEVETWSKEDRGDFELVLAGGLELPLGQHFSLTTKAEVNTNLLMTTSVAGTAGLKLRF